MYKITVRPVALLTGAEYAKQNKTRIEDEEFTMLVRLIDGCMTVFTSLIALSFRLSVQFIHFQSNLSNDHIPIELVVFLFV